MVKTFIYGFGAALGVVAFAALPTMAQTTSGTVEIFTETTPGSLTPGGTAADALSGRGNIELGETDGGLDGLQGGLSLGLGGGELTLRSLTQADWDGGLADDWFNDAWSIYGAGLQPLLAPFGLGQADLRTAFDTVDADARLSDANIESVTELGDGSVEIDLAGFLEPNLLIDLATTQLGLPSISGLPGLPDFFASEVVAYDYQGNSGFLYSIGEAPTASGVASADGTLSFTGNYQVVIASNAPSVPEPMGLIGVAVAGGFAAWSQRRRRSAM
ncbi:NF038130 family PEP-CTERM protein [Leptothoe kymatousa]|uniref:NF038130 family PEP-CTERM protein n=1 Tax=Leptothoe kymatousa TAU-MAC 1615 TaxID=2364775 RepID=A0ABS5Y3Q8_9CYAN|nr:NF038130 family PEP-CTERM protein [Leptothoe kymatousa]MBT9312473.1 NF038130 family PEP-CTERM protein [Leptothoe kymatousa TAU-MAC 1615]